MQPATLTLFWSTNLKMTILDHNEFGNVDINEEDINKFSPFLYVLSSFSSKLKQIKLQKT